jgi:hypothetical protein
MHVRHGGISIDIPESWSDQSTLLFTAPFPTETVPTAARLQQAAEAVSVSFIRDAGQTAKEVLAAQAQELGQHVPDFAVVSEGPFDCGLGKGWRYTQRFSVDGVSVQQLAVACPAGELVVVATAAAADYRFGHCEAQLRTILGSLRSTAQS